MVNNKRGMSEIVAGVLITLITVTAIGVLATVLISFVNTNLEESTRCTDVQNKVFIVQESSCYSEPAEEDTGGNPSTKVKIKFGNIKVEEMLLFVENNGAVQSISIKDGQEAQLNEDIKVLTSANDKTLKLPVANGERTYIITNLASKTVKVGVMVNGKSCGVLDETILDECRQ